MSETNTNNLEHFNLNCTSAAGVDRETSWNEKDTTMVIVFIILLLMALLLLFLALFTMLHRRRRRKKPKEELKEEVPELKELDECGVIVVSKMHSAKSIVSEKSDDNLVSAVEQSTTNDRTTAGPSYGLMSIHHKSLDKSYGNRKYFHIYVFILCLCLCYVFYGFI